MIVFYAKHVTSEQCAPKKCKRTKNIAAAQRKYATCCRKICNGMRAGRCPLAILSLNIGARRALTRKGQCHYYWHCTDEMCCMF